jgi:hypothetical protein
VVSAHVWQTSSHISSNITLVSERKGPSSCPRKKAGSSEPSRRCHQSEAEGLEAEAKAESSSQGAGTSASASAKGKAKDPDPDWTKIPFNTIPITSFTRPRFSQVVGSSSESPIGPPSKVAVKAVSVAEYPVYSPAIIAAWTAMNAPAGQNQEN